MPQNAHLDTHKRRHVRRSQSKKMYMLHWLQFETNLFERSTTRSRRGYVNCGYNWVYYGYNCGGKRPVKFEHYFDFVVMGSWEKIIAL